MTSHSPRWRPFLGFRMGSARPGSRSQHGRARRSPAEAGSGPVLPPGLWGPRRWLSGSRSPGPGAHRSFWWSARRSPRRRPTVSHGQGSADPGPRSRLRRASVSLLHPLLGAPCSLPPMVGSSAGLTPPAHTSKLPVGSLCETLGSQSRGQKRGWALPSTPEVSDRQILSGAEKGSASLPSGGPLHHTRDTVACSRP